MIAALALSGCGSSDRSTAPRYPAGPDFSEARTTTTDPAPLAASDGRRPIPPDDQLFFGFDSDELDHDGRVLLANVAAWAKAHPAREVIVHGHADAAGDRDYNLELSARRARAVADHLRSLGVPLDRVTVVARGENDAVIEPPQGNRRVVVFGNTVALSRRR
ncbi:MAG: OmpA family protein [Deltaproteobacteria bacterium]|nr:OmpA family protein [Kofleriaceae bacterium]